MKNTDKDVIATNIPMPIITKYNSSNTLKYKHLLKSTHIY